MPTATVIFFSSQPARARLAAELFNAAADPGSARALAADDGVPAELARDATLQVTLGSRGGRLHPPAARSEQWPLLDPLGEHGEPMDVPTERVRQHVLDLVQREGWSATR